MSKSLKVVSLAERLDDSTKWSCVDALRATLKEIEGGIISPESIAIHYYEEDKSGRLRHRFFCAGLTYERHVALLEVAKREAIRDWTGEN